MSPNAISSVTTIATQAVRQQPDQAEIRKQEANRSIEDRTQSIKTVEEPTATVNTLGQTIGARINTSA